MIPSHSIPFSIGPVLIKPPLPAKPGEVERAKQAREGAGELRGAGAIAAAFCATRGEPSPGLTADPSHFASLRGRGGYKNLLPRRSRGRSSERSKLGRARVNCGTRVLLRRRSVQHAASPPPALRPTPPTPLRCAGGEVIKTSSPGEAGGGRASEASSGGGRGIAGCGCYCGGVQCNTRRALPRPDGRPLPLRFAAREGRFLGTTTPNEVGGAGCGCFAAKSATMPECSWSSLLRTSD